MNNGARGRGPGASGSLLDRALRIFTDVRAGESGTALLLTLNVFLILTAYYLVRVLREPLLPGEARARVASYSSAAQALLLLFLVPAYGALAARVPRRRLINYVTAIFVACLGAFFVLARIGVPVGVPFYIWVGIFNMMIVAQFWSFANDLYTTEEGKRLFPIVAFGAASGSVFGSYVARPLREAVGVYPMFLFAAGLLVIAVIITNIIDARERRRTEAAVPDAMTSGTMPAATPQLRTATGEFKAAGAEYATASGTMKALKREDIEKLRAAPQAPAPVGRAGAFALVLRNQYLLLIALLILTVNWVNSNGGYLINRMNEGMSRDELVAFNSSYLGTINLLGMFLQLFVVSRLIKHAGVRLSLLLVPMISLGGYALVALSPTRTFTRIAKTGENAADYSLMNTLRQVLFLPTTREEKYAAKQVIDSLIVRFGDVLSAGLVLLAGTLQLGLRQFTLINLALVVLWLFLAAAVGRRYERLTAVTA